MAGIALHQVQQRKAHAQVVMQRWIEFDREQAVGRQSTRKQRFGHHAGAGTQFDYAACADGELIDHSRGQFAAGGCDGRDLPRIAHPASKEIPTQGMATKSDGFDVHAPSLTGKMLAAR